MEQRVEMGMRYFKQFDVGMSPDTCRAAMLGIKQAHFAHKFTRSAHAEHTFIRSSKCLDDLNRSIKHDITLRTCFTFLEQDRLCSEDRTSQGLCKVRNFNIWKCVK